jgi:hypothetical protein
VTDKNLDIPGSGIVKKVFLYWSGSGSLDNKVTLGVDNTNYTVTADAGGTKTFTRTVGTSTLSYFAARADITSLVTGKAKMTVSDLNWNNADPYCSDNSAYGGWAMVAIYEKQNLPVTKIHINTDQFRYTAPAGIYSSTINNISDITSDCDLKKSTLNLIVFDAEKSADENFYINGVLDTKTNNFKGSDGPNLDIFEEKDLPGLTPASASLTYTIETSGTGSDVDGMFDYVKVLTYPTCPEVCNTATYEWTLNGTTVVGNTQSITATQPGTYSVKVNDCTGCIAVDNVVVRAVSGITSASASAPPINCSNNADSTLLTVTVTGGVAPYQYSLNGGTSQSAHTFVVPAGMYTVTVIDSNGCTINTNLVEITSCGPVDINKCFTIKNVNGGRALSADNSNADPGKQVRTRAVNGTPAKEQIWKFEKLYSNAWIYRIINQGVTRLSLEADNGTTALDGKVIIDPYTNASFQHWELTQTGANYYITPEHYTVSPNNRLVVKNADPGDNKEVVINGNNIPTGSLSRQWSITPTTCPATAMRGIVPVVQQTTTPGNSEELKPFSASVSPNPGVSFFNVSVTSKDNSTLVDIRLMNANGKVLSVQKTKANTTLKIRADNLSQGMYFVEVSQGAERKVLKLIKTNNIN